MRFCALLRHDSRKKQGKERRKRDTERSQVSAERDVAVFIEAVRKDSAIRLISAYVREKKEETSRPETRKRKKRSSPAYPFETTGIVKRGSTRKMSGRSRLTLKKSRSRKMAEGKTNPRSQRPVRKRRSEKKGCLGHMKPTTNERSFEEEKQSNRRRLRLRWT